MLAADDRAAALIVWLTDLATDTRLRVHQRARLTAYLTKLGSATTDKREDLDVAGIQNEFFRKVKN